MKGICSQFANCSSVISQEIPLLTRVDLMCGAHRCESVNQCIVPEQTAGNVQSNQVKPTP